MHINKSGFLFIAILCSTSCGETENSTPKAPYVADAEWNGICRKYEDAWVRGNGALTESAARSNANKACLSAGGEHTGQYKTWNTSLPYGFLVFCTGMRRNQLLSVYATDLAAAQKKLEKRCSKNKGGRLISVSKAPVTPPKELEKQLKYLFGFYDKDNDGVVTESELPSKGKQAFARVFWRCDINQDRKLTIEEILSVLLEN